MNVVAHVSGPARTGFLVITLISVTSLTSHAQRGGIKNPKKYSSAGGYSGKGVTTAKPSKLAPPARATQLPTQPRITYKPAKPAVATTRPSRKPVSQPTPPTPSRVTFPSRPTPSKVKPQISTPSPVIQRPPVVFYPKPSKPTTPQPTVTVPTPSLNQPRPTRPAKPSTLPSGPALRPPTSSYTKYRKPPVIQAPPTITNQITNITNQTNNTNINIRNRINSPNYNFVNQSGNITNWLQSGRWKNQATINSNNWNGNPWWYRPEYHTWHHGHWNRHSNLRGHDSWRHVDASNNTWLRGLVAWGLGNLIYRTGYQVYTNPYYRKNIIVIGGTTIDYSRPICVLNSPYELAYQNDETRAQLLRNQALALFNNARQAFYLGAYDQALADIDRSIALVPDDPSAHEFRGLTLFALRRYDEAAEVIHSVLAVAPGWDWTTLSGLYSDDSIYINQLRTLEQTVRVNPRLASARFLLAYHYITMGHVDNAIGQLESVLAIYPDDRLSADLLALLRKDEDGEANSDYEFSDSNIKIENLKGAWTAKRPDGEIELELDDDSFSWDFDLDSNGRKYKGKYALQGNLLILATETGSQMIGTVTQSDAKHFHFRLLGTGDNDPGLSFTRS